MEQQKVNEVSTPQVLLQPYCNVIILDSDDPSKLSDETRSLGLVVCRGPAVVVVCPADSMEPIANPFLQQE